MSIFNFGKKKQEKTQKKDIIRTAAVDKAFNPTRYEFSDINNKNDSIDLNSIYDIKDKKIIDDIDISNDNINPIDTLKDDKLLLELLESGLVIFIV